MQGIIDTSDCVTGAKNAFAIAAAFILYAALSVLFFGMPIIGHLPEVYIGGGTDPICHIWAIAWWPYAIVHRINPLITHTLWAPEGYNLVWGTDIPGPSLLIYPVTRLFGPVVSYNILCLLAPPASAVSGFLLCRYVSGRFWPALEDANFALKFVPRRSNENVSRGLINLDDNAAVFVSRCVHLGTGRDMNEMKGAQFTAGFTSQQFGAASVARPFDAAKFREVGGGQQIGAAA